MRAFRWISTAAILGAAATGFAACSDGGETRTGGATTTTATSTSTTVTGTGGTGGSSSTGGTGGGTKRPPAGEDLARDILTTDLELDKIKTDAVGKKAVDDLETAWLKTLDCPVDYKALCP